MEELVRNWLETKDDRVFNKILGQLNKLIHSLAKKYDINNSLEDLVQEGRLALLYACKTYFDRERKSFLNHAYYTIRFAIWKYATRDRVIPRVCKSQYKGDFGMSAVPTCHSEIEQLADKIGTTYKKTLEYARQSFWRSFEDSEIDVSPRNDDQVIDQVSIMETVETLVETLTTMKPLHVELFNRNVFGEETNIVLGAEHNLTHQRVHQIVARMKEKLRDSL